MSYDNDDSMFKDEIIKILDYVVEGNVESGNIGSNASGVGSVEEE